MTILIETENTPEAWSRRAVQIEPWDACGWSFDGMMDRHEEAIEQLDPRPGERLLDWGCGTGELVRLIPPSVHYIGFDWAEGMIQRARDSHPDWRFQSWEPTGEFDLVACIGPFNLPGGWSKQMTWYTLRRLFARTKRLLVASLYAGTDDSCLQYTMGECGRFARSESYYGRAERWRHNDILIVLERTRPSS